MLKELCRTLPPVHRAQRCKNKPFRPLRTPCEHNKMLAMPVCRVIITFTYNLWYAATQTDHSQISSPPPKWYLKFPCPRGSGSPFPGGGLFRRPRFSSGQIRNAASGPQGRHSGQRSGFELRFLATFLLQSAGGFYPGGSGRVDWQEERPEGAAQAQRGDHGFCGAEANSRSFAQSRRFTQTDPKQVRNPRASTDFGTGSGCREKKTLLATADSVKSSSILIQALRVNCGCGFAALCSFVSNTSESSDSQTSRARPVTVVFLFLMLTTSQVLYFTSE
jgi:hypothetical protein